MYKAQNRQFLSNLLIAKRSKIIKFCYFLVVIFFISCGNNKPSEKSEIGTYKNQNKTTKTTETVSNTKTILCFGDSITAGYGLDDTNDAFPGLLQKKIDSLGLKYTIVNSGVSGETSAGGKSRIDWVIKQKPAIFILELGANDGLRGVELNQTKTNLQTIINIVNQKSPQTTIVLAGMQLPPNMGLEYTSGFKQLFIDLASQNKIEFIPFILKDVGGIASLNQKDGIHPNIEGHKILANTVWEVLEPLLKG